jgi:hypothetical protein
MISEKDIQRVVEENAQFRQAIIAARYYGDTDRVELVTPWCILIVDRQRIEEFRRVSPNDMESISVSPSGIHIDKADIDINSAGLITYISKQLKNEVANSF